jgi:hypothetical protein
MGIAFFGGVEVSQSAIMFQPLSRKCPEDRLASQGLGNFVKLAVMMMMMMIQDQGF